MSSHPRTDDADLHAVDRSDRDEQESKGFIGILVSIAFEDGCSPVVGRRARPDCDNSRENGQDESAGSTTAAARLRWFLFVAGRNPLEHEEVTSTLAPAVARFNQRMPT